MKIQAILFDCDGTLVESEVVCAKADISILAEFGIHYASPEDFLTEFMGVANGKIVEILNERHGTAIPVAWFVEEYARRAVALVPQGLGFFPETVAYIKNLAARKVKMAVVSNGKKDVVRLELEIAGIIECFGDNIFTVEDGPNPKPAPDLYLMGAKALGVEPSQCLVVEDSVPGARAGVAAGAQVLGYNGFAHDKKGVEKRLLEAGCSLVISDLSDINTYLAEERVVQPLGLC